MESTNASPILIVDDDPATRDLLTTYLRREGFETREAPSGEEALSLIEHEAVSLVILDMRLPGISGLDVIRALREQPKTAALPIMVLTGKGDDYPLATSLGVGADAYLTKPIRLDELVARVRARLRIQRVAAEQALRESEELYRALVDQSADGILVSDQTGRYVEANPAICRMLGYSRDEVLARSTPSLSADDDPLTPEDMDVRLAETAAGAGLLVERRYRRKDGTSLPAEVSFSQLPDGRLQRNIRDITARLAVDAERARLASAVQQTADAIWMNDMTGVITYVNPAFTQAYGYEASEIVGHHAGTLDGGDQDPAFFLAIWDSVRAGRTWSGTIINRRKDGSPIEVESVISVIRGADGQLAGYVQADRDVTNERDLERALERNARERDTIETALARIDPAGSAEEIAGAACTVINGLPGVDSTMAVALDGVGGSVLAVVGKLTTTFSPGMPVPARRAAYLHERGTSGAWFEEWLPDAAAGSWSEAITATGLLATAYSPLRSPRGVIGVVGIASHDPTTAPSLIENMPALAAFASILGALLGPKLEARQRNAEGQSAIQAIITDRAFHPVFQPIVDLRTGETVGYEALTRFDSGQRPDLCFADAWSVGLGAQLEIATLEAAVAAGKQLPTGIWLDLNVSPRLLADPERLRMVLWQAGRPLVLEVTEHEVIEDYDYVRGALHALGNDVRVAVDDAGVGIANFGHIIELRPDFVKLDISMVRRINAHLGRQAMVVGMRHFSLTVGCRLIAEGVETEDEATTLRALGVEFGQGYLYGHPGPAADWTAARASAPEPSQLELPQAPERRSTGGRG